MRLFLLAAAALLAPPALADGPAKPLCQDAKVRLAQQRERYAGLHKLGEEPNARQTLAVLRETNGCSRPVDIRQDIGGQPEAPGPRGP